MTTATQKPAENLVAAAELLDAIPDGELDRCLGVDGQPCGATPPISRATVRAVGVALRWHGTTGSPVIPSGLLDVARAILATKWADR